MRPTSANTPPAGAPRRHSYWPTSLAWLISIAASVVCLNNTYAAEPELEAQAYAVACAASAASSSLALPSSSSSALPSSSAPPGKKLPGKQPPAKQPPSAQPPDRAAPPPSCDLQTTLWEANPLWRAFEFVRPGGARVRVQCQREHIAFGNYICKVVP